jgi:hypothetical protein
MLKRYAEAKDGPQNDALASTLNMLKMKLTKPNSEPRIAALD